MELNTVATGGRRKKNRNRKEDSQELIYLMLVLQYFINECEDVEIPWRDCVLRMYTRPFLFGQKRYMGPRKDKQNDISGNISISWFWKIE